MVPLHQMFVPCSTQPGWWAPSWTSTLLSCHSLSFRDSSHRILPRKCQAGSCLRTSVILLVFVGCSFPRWHISTSPGSISPFSLKYQEDPPWKPNIKLCCPPHHCLSTYPSFISHITFAFIITSYSVRLYIYLLPGCNLKVSLVRTWLPCLS